MPVSSMMGLPPVRIEMSSSIALRRSPKPGRLHRANIERAAQLVDYERGQGLAFHFLGDHQQRLTRARNLLEQAAAGPSCC